MGATCRCVRTRARAGGGRGWLDCIGSESSVEHVRLIEAHDSDPPLICICRPCAVAQGLGPPHLSLDALWVFVVVEYSSFCQNVPDMQLLCVLEAVQLAQAVP